MKCIIVESPAKAKKFSQMLSKEEYIVTSSFGHFRDLDSKKMSIDLETFDPEYIITNTKIANQLKSFCKQVGPENIILGPDDDREGEAIGFHIAELLKIPIQNTKRIKFNEISKKAILNALKTPTRLDMNWIDSQQGRRIIDRLVGYSISPLLWQYIPGKTGLSAGRVQSATLKIINEKEKQINDYKVKYNYEISAEFENETEDKKYKADYEFSKEEKNLEEEDIIEIMSDSLENLDYTILKKNVKQEKVNPPPPFTTSTLQQEGTNRGIDVVTTMKIAQQLYESGLITYMRTDSVNLSSDFISKTKEEITDKYTEDYFKERHYKTKTKGAQEAHEAIRPTDITRSSIEGQHPLQVKLYDLIYKRTIASQMSTSILNVYTLELTNEEIKGVYKLKDKVIHYDGWQKVYSREMKVSELRDIGEDKIFKIIEIKSENTPDSPPPRYTESSLIKTLESTGIGRPSTFASILDTLYKREYIVKQATKKEVIPRKIMTLHRDNPEELEEDENPLTRQPQKNKLFITELGEKILEYLEKHFDNLIERGFTSSIEDKLDEVATGGIKWKTVVREVFDTFHPIVEEQRKIKNTIKVNKNKPLGILENGKSVSVGSGKYGPYLLVQGEEKKGQFYKLSYFLEKNEKSMEEVTLEEAEKIIKEFEYYKKRKQTNTGKKVYIKVKYEEKDKVKKLGAVWDKTKRSWCFYDSLSEENKRELRKYL